MGVMGDLELGEIVGEVWDAGNATGLDGWVGPGRGTLPIDDQAVWSRDRDVAAALPHIERAVIQRLIEKYEAKAREGSIYIDGVRQRSMFDKTVALLRAELEGDDRA